MAFLVPEKYRVKKGPMGSDASYGNNGVFAVHSLKLSRRLTVIASDQGGWEHVSVSLGNRCPTLEEMCFVKSLFWDDEDCVMQLHPPKSSYVDNHPYCLHLWRPVEGEIPAPPSALVGFVKKESL